MMDRNFSFLCLSFLINFILIGLITSPKNLSIHLILDLLIIINSDNSTIQMAPVSAGKQRMNQFLQERRKKINQNKNFRKQRIIKHYRKAVQSYDQQLNSKLNPTQYNPNNTESNPQIQRKINFYNSVFQQPHVNERLNKNKKNKKHNNQQKHTREQQPKDEKTVIQEKLNNLKDKKVKFIKKMNKQKTPRGQPVMRNMISYALTKIQETIHKEKLQKIITQESSKKQTQKHEQQAKNTNQQGNNSNAQKGSNSFQHVNKSRPQGKNQYHQNSKGNWGRK